MHALQTGTVNVSNLTKVFKVSKSHVQFLRHPFKSEQMIALDNVTFSVVSGSCLGILGSNGAGKTTLMKIISTLISPTTGDVSIDGIDVEENPSAVKKIIGCVVNDERSFFWRLTGRQNLYFFATLNNLTKKTATHQIEKLVGLTGLTEHIDKPFQKYSSGMKQKLAIVRALLADPRVLLLDEPTKNLDPLFKNKLYTFLKETIHGKMKKTVLMTTHDLQEAEYLCDTIMVLNKGKVLLHDSIAILPEIKNIFKSLSGH